MVEEFPRIRGPNIHPPKWGADHKDTQKEDPNSIHGNSYILEIQLYMMLKTQIPNSKATLYQH